MCLSGGAGPTGYPALRLNSLLFRASDDFRGSSTDLVRTLLSWSRLTQPERLERSAPRGRARPASSRAGIPGRTCNRSGTAERLGNPAPGHARYHRTLRSPGSPSVAISRLPASSWQGAGDETAIIRCGPYRTLFHGRPITLADASWRMTHTNRCCFPTRVLRCVDTYGSTMHGNVTARPEACRAVSPGHSRAADR